MKRYVSILMYHRIGKFSSIKEHRALYCNYKRFAVQMWFLKFFKYRILSLDDVLFMIKSKTTFPAKSIVLTFDDGYNDFYEYAYPVLKCYGFPATVYVLSDLVGNRAVWFEKEGRETPLLLNRTQLLELKSNNIEIGSHGRLHIKLDKIPTEEVKRELVGSKKRLENVLGCEIRHFCYPYGKFTDRVVEMVKEAGYSSGVTCIRAGVNGNANPFLLPRKAISFGDNLIGFLWKIHIKNKPKQRL